MVNNDLISDYQDIVNVFKEYFVSISSKLKEPIKPFDLKLLQDFVDSKVNDGKTFVNCSFVSNCLSNMDIKRLRD